MGVKRVSAKLYVKRLPKGWETKPYLSALISRSPVQTEGYLTDLILSGFAEILPELLHQSIGQEGFIRTTRILGTNIVLTGKRNDPYNADFSFTLYKSEAKRDKGRT